MSFDPSVITGQIENFIQSAKKLEADLDAERKRSQKIAVEYVDVRGRLEKAVKSLQVQIQERDTKLKEVEQRVSARDESIQKLNQSLDVQRQTEAALHQRNAAIIDTEKKVRAELTRYQKAWSQVQAREAEARKVMVDLQTSRQSLEEHRQHIDQLKQHAEAYRRELTNAQKRIHALETQLKSVQHEYQKLSHGKRAADTEVVRLNQELQQERQRAHEEHQRLAAAERQKLEELGKRSSQDQVKQQATEKENAELRDRIRTLQAMMHAEGERMRLQMQQLTRALEAANESHGAELSKATDKAERFELVNIRNQETIGDLRGRVEEQDKSLALLRLENTQLQAMHESTRKSLSKQMIIERLRLEAEIERLNALVENLERADIRIQRIDANAFDGEILMAQPVSDTRSSPNTAVHVGPRAPELSN